MQRMSFLLASRYFNIHIINIIYNYLYISDIEISEMKILIMRILNKLYVPLINLPKTCFEEVAAELYSPSKFTIGILKVPRYL